MTSPVVFIDTETTGLDPARHELWEIALITANGLENVWRPKPKHFERADAGALRITSFYERTEDGWPWESPRKAASDITFWTSGMHLVAAVPSFDATFLTALLGRYGLVPAWHYHLVDVEALAAGRLGIAPPWDSAALADALGIDSADPQFAKHTALGDARWAKAIYEAVLGREEG